MDYFLLIYILIINNLGHDTPEKQRQSHDILLSGSFPDHKKNVKSFTPDRIFQWDIHNGGNSSESQVTKARDLRSNSMVPTNKVSAVCTTAPLVPTSSPTFSKALPRTLNGHKDAPSSTCMHVIMVGQKPGEVAYNGMGYYERVSTKHETLALLQHVEQHPIYKKVRNGAWVHLWERRMKHPASAPQQGGPAITAVKDNMYLFYVPQERMWVTG